MSEDAPPSPKSSANAVDWAFGRGIFIVGLFAAVSSAARVAQDIAVAWRFGTGSVVDAYYFVASLAQWPVAVALSVLTLLVVPLEAGLRQHHPGSALIRFRAEMLAIVLAMACVSLPLAWWAMNAIASGLLGGLSPSTATVAVAGVPAIAAMVPLGMTGALLAAWLVASGRYALTLIEAIPALVLLGAVLFVPGMVLFWAATMGVLAQVMVMVIALVAARALPSPRIGLSSPAWQGLAQSMLLVVLAQLIFALVPLVDSYFAVRMEEGTLATLNYANRLVLGVLGLAGMALQRVGLPLLAQLEVASPEQARRTALRWAAFMGAAGLVVAVFFAVMSEHLVALLFERGRFTTADRQQVALLVRWGMLQLPPFLAGLTAVTALAAAGAPGFMMLAAVTGIIVKVCASALLATDHGAVGLQVATAIMYATVSTLALFALRRRLRGTALG